MPADLLTMVNLDLLYPPFLEALLNCLTECRMLGVDYKVYSGHRPTDEQAKLYEIHLKGGPKAAPPGLSAHNYGLAVDCAQRLPNKKLTWDIKSYDTLLTVLPKHGLLSGKAYNDLPHINWPEYESARQLLPLKVVYNATVGDEPTKLKAVWSHIEK
jgi:peptidoglycan L-alanyl-D-glutamate endopeptidase CwlK